MAILLMGMSIQQNAGDQEANCNSLKHPIDPQRAEVKIWETIDHESEQEQDASSPQVMKENRRLWSSSAQPRLRGVDNRNADQE